MIGPFKPAPGGYKWVFVAIDKFSKWIEYKPLTSSSAKKAVEFFKEIFHRFGLANSIITDLGSTFTGTEFWDYCDEQCVQIKYVSVAHPRANGQVERANGMILEALKKRIFRKDESAPGRWLAELPAVVWGLRTQPSRNTGVSPYFMIYGSEAVLPTDIQFRAPRIEQFNEENSNATREDELNRVEEERLASCLRTAKYLESIRRYYNRNVHPRTLFVGDLVLRRKQKTEGIHKLSSLWEGPFYVKEKTRAGSFRLSRMDGSDVPNSWHMEHLRKFYV